MGQGDEGWKLGQEVGWKSIIRACGSNMEGTVCSEKGVNTNYVRVWKELLPSLFSLHLY